MIRPANVRGQDGDIAVTTIKFTGNCDDVCAQLKASFEARDAQFNASVQAMLNGQAPSLAPAAPAAKPPAAAKPHASAGWALERSSTRGSSRNETASLRDRLRTSLRVTPAR